MKLLAKLLLFSLYFLFTGCAATNGASQAITINSNVQGAIIELDGKKIGYTPFTGVIEKDKTEQIKVSKPGYVAGNIEKKQDKAMRFAFFSYMAVASIYSAYLTHQQPRGCSSEGFCGGEDISELSSGTSAAVMIFMMMDMLFDTEDESTSTAWEYSPFQYYVQLKEENASKQSSLDFSKELAIRYFATVNHSQIAIDAGENYGEYANAMANIIERCTETKRNVAIQSINEALEKSKGNPVQFGDSLYARVSHAK
ncbi:MAG: PEGA domain-containing protein [Fibromonadaceae bacterium]|jgi:hypothetical protein|nr:PEGA domain-containing protein [Fibromonadaceae bacterium]